MIQIKIHDLIVDVVKDFKMSEEEFLNLTDDQKLVLLDEHLDSIKIRSSSKIKYDGKIEN